MAKPADSTEEILAVPADRQKNDRGWGIDRTDEYNVNTTAERYDTERRNITVINIKQVNTRRGS